MSKGPEVTIRLADLEARFTHTERILQDLSDVTNQQWAQIDRLENKLKQLKERHSTSARDKLGSLCEA